MPPRESDLHGVDLHRALDTFPRRHIGPRDRDVREMLDVLGFDTLDGLADATVPGAIRLKGPLELDGLPEEPLGEFELLEQLKEMASENLVYRSYIGMGYSDTIVPPVVLRNVMENPGWYTQYTPYQAEISQGRLEALLLFQTSIAEITGLPLAGASLLDEATAAAEAFGMCRAIAKGERRCFFVADDCHPQTIGVVRTRADAVGVDIVVGDPETADFEALAPSGVLLQYPATDGRLADPRAVIERIHGAGAVAVMAADLLALCVVESPGSLGADIAVGSSQRFGVPMGFGGPHAGYLSTLDKHARKLPGRLVGVSLDRAGNTAYRLAVQTREQHIRRERATSNICTAQVLLAIMSSMYCVYHGPDGLRDIATRVHGLTRVLAAGLRRLGHTLRHDTFFDTLRVDVASGQAENVISNAWERGMNLRPFLVEDDGGQLRSDGSLGVALDETSRPEDVMDLLEAFSHSADGSLPFEFADLEADRTVAIPETLRRTTPVLTHEHFSRHHSETEMLRYLHRLQARDLSLTTSMIPLGSCTMKLNATVEMIPVTWPEFGRLHPYAPADQVMGYQALFEQLETWLGEITGLPVVSLQPNAGSQGELAGLLAIRRFHHAADESRRDVCLIPVSAHGTNAASAVIAGYRCVAVACDDAGNVDLDDLRKKCETHADELGALMITYPSTHGVFEESVKAICELVHQHGGQVYMDGANMNAQVGLTSPAAVGADVCHLNLHKTFSIPHGGGGPGVGPICAAEHLRDFMPGDPVHGEGAVSAASYGSASILPISWVYIALMGAAGLTRASQVAILNANYMAKRLSEHYDVLYTGPGGLVAHEFIIDCRGFEKSEGIVVEDIAKRLMDFGFHAPTMSFPVPGTLMVEPTESESREELDRFCDAMISIRGEIRAIERGQMDREDNPLKHAPHTAAEVTGDQWSHAYSREKAAWPADWLRNHKYWPPVARIDNAYGDRNLMCTCPPLQELADG